MVLMMNDYIYKKYNTQKKYLSGDNLKKLKAEAIFLSELGVQNEEDHKIYYYLSKFGPQIIKEMSNCDEAKQNLIIKSMFQLRNQIKPQTIYNIYRSAAFCLKQYGYPIKKIAYLQNFDEDTFHVAPHNIEKWVRTIHDMYDAMSYYQIEFYQALEHFTKNWDEMEKGDFKKWISFYQEGAQNKYKTAQYFQQVEEQLKPKIPGFPKKEFTPEELLEKKRKALISRLDAAEKIVRDPDVQRYLGSRLDMSLNDWLADLQKVKRMVMTSPLRSAQASLFDDIIIRESNKLITKGKQLAGYELLKIAQVKAPSPQVTTSTPPVLNTKLPETGSPATSQDVKPNEVEDESKDEEKGQKAINKLIKGLNFSDQNDSEDEELIVEAQLETPLSTPDVAPEAPLGQVENQEVLPEAVTEEQPEEIVVEDSDAIDEALKNVSIQEIIDDWEAIANIFRNREINRMLAKVDLKMDARGISAFFPSIGEIANKNFDCSQYSLTRTDEIISQLRGSFSADSRETVHDMSKPDAPSTDPVVNKIKQNVIDEKNKEEAARNRRKEQEARAVTPVIENPAPELNTPVEVKPNNINPINEVKKSV